MYAVKIHGLVGTIAIAGSCKCILKKPALAQPQRKLFKSAVLPVRALRSERLCFPKLPLLNRAAKAEREPETAIHSRISAPAQA